MKIRTWIGEDVEKEIYRKQDYQTVALPSIMNGVLYYHLYQRAPGGKVDGQFVLRYLQTNRSKSGDRIPD